MTKATLKNNLYKAIDKIDDSSFLEAIYKILRTKLDESDEIKLSDDHAKILDLRKKSLSNGESITLSWDEVKKIARKGAKK